MLAFITFCFSLYGSLLKFHRRNVLLKFFRHTNQECSQNFPSLVESIFHRKIFFLIPQRDPFCWTLLSFHLPGNFSLCAHHYKESTIFVQDQELRSQSELFRPTQGKGKEEKIGLDWLTFYFAGSAAWGAGEARREPVEMALQELCISAQCLS